MNDAQLMRRAKIVLWDEASMMNQWAFEADDRRLRDIRNCPDLPFGGIVFVLGGRVDL